MPWVSWGAGVARQYPGQGAMVAAPKFHHRSTQAKPGSLGEKAEQQAHQQAPTAQHCGFAKALQKRGKVHTNPYLNQNSLILMQ